MQIFEKFPKLTISFILILIFCLILIVAEIVARKLGLGQVVLYETNPVYGYRPKPNQLISRDNKHFIKINNLGLRASADWDPNITHDKILFIGDSVTYGGSYIDNNQLFSELYVKQLNQENNTNYKAGNAGVNGWGVMNVQALIQEWGFLPADTVITILLEGDFYRGLNKIGGQPFWTRNPKLALEELLAYANYRYGLNKTSPMDLSKYSPNELSKIVKFNASALKKLDDHLKSNNKKHMIFISPTKLQCEGIDKEDNYVTQELAKLEVRYSRINVDLKTCNDLYHDSVHFSNNGHLIVSTSLHKTAG